MCDCTAFGQAWCEGACVDTQTDAKNCGACGHDCLGATCSAGLCETRTVSSRKGSRGLAKDASHLYFVADIGTFGASNYLSYKAALGSANSAWSIADSVSGESAIAVDATHAYLLSSHNVTKVSLAAGTHEHKSLGGTNCGGLALNSTAAYVTNSAEGTVMGIGLDGVSAFTVAGGQASPHGVVVDEEFAYWTNSADGTVMGKALAGGSPEVLASGQSMPWALALDSGALAWTNIDTNTVMPLEAGSTTPVQLANAPSIGCAIAIDGDNVYWGEGLGTISKVARSGGTPTVLATGVVNPYAIVVDDTRVYWTDGVIDNVLSVPK